MAITLDALNLRLLGEWQRNFPLVSRPFGVIGDALGCTETEVLQRLSRLSAAGAVSRVGAALRPNAAGASTLAAIAVPEPRIDEVATLISAEPGVNHSYLRENDWNIWFVATGPDRAHIDGTLKRIEAATGLAVLDLPLVQPYHIDLGFSLDGTRQGTSGAAPADPSMLRHGDHAVLQGLTQGLAIVPRPFAALADELGRAEIDVIERIRTVTAAGIVSRLGIILRHRALGWRSNAMVVWNLPEADVDRVGVVLAAATGVTLCYQRRPNQRHWPFNLYCMIHARSRDEALTTLGHAAAEAGIADLPRQVLFSTHCFKQTGAMVVSQREAAA
ncbi:MAG TPA: AsnC family transcriptional regulator [Thermohalobaculum sp.]|nr:AsnC family transcriptional regulator [Thermohalobaculum sp.]